MAYWAGPTHTVANPNGDIKNSLSTLKPTPDAKPYAPRRCCISHPNPVILLARLTTLPKCYPCSPIPQIGSYPSSFLSFNLISGS